MLIQNCQEIIKNTWKKSNFYAQFYQSYNFVEKNFWTNLNIVSVSTLNYLSNGVYFIVKKALLHFCIWCWMWSHCLEKNFIRAKKLLNFRTLSKNNYVEFDTLYAFISILQQHHLSSGIEQSNGWQSKFQFCLFIWKLRGILR